MKNCEKCKPFTQWIHQGKTDKFYIELLIINLNKIKLIL